MDDPQVYLEKLSAFSRMLRLEGLPVSPKETADACQILVGLGFEDRERVKTALRIMLTAWLAARMTQEAEKMLLALEV